MAITQDDFKKVWASTSSVPEYTFSDTDYKNGWEFVGNLPPTRAMWDELQRKNDEKMHFLQENGSMCFDSVTDMKSSNLDAEQTAFTKGYYSINDGGSSIYAIRAKTQDDVDDGGSIIFLDNGNVAELIAGDIVNVKQFGAVGDGVKDDTTSFRNALAFGSGKSFVVPEGNYVINSTLFADGVKNVIDNGAYLNVKPVYPVEEPFIKDLKMIKYEGTVTYTNQDRYPQGFCRNQNNGNFVMAGVDTDNANQNIFISNNSDMTTIVNTYDYTTLGHVNGLTHNPSIGKYVSTLPSALAFIDDSTMEITETKSTPTNYTCIAYDTSCKFYVGVRINNANTIVLDALDDNLNVIRSVGFPIKLISSEAINGFCCHDGHAFVVTFGYVCEYSLLGEEVQIHNIGPNYEKEDCDFYDGKIWFTVAKERGYVALYSCDGKTIDYNTSSLGYQAYPCWRVNGKDVYSLDALRFPGKYFVDSYTDNVQIANMPPNCESAFGFLFVEGVDGSNVKQTFWRHTSLAGHRNDIYVRTRRSTVWTPWEKIGKNIQAGTIKNASVTAQGVTTFDVVFPEEFSDAPVVTLSFEASQGHVAANKFTLFIFKNSITTTGFKINFANSDTNNYTVNIHWIAVLP